MFSGLPNLGGMDLGSLLTNPAIMDMVRQWLNNATYTAEELLKHKPQN